MLGFFFVKNAIYYSNYYGRGLGMAAGKKYKNEDLGGKKLKTGERKRTKVI